MSDTVDRPPRLDLARIDDPTLPRHRCPYPWQQMLVDLDGGVTPCCFFSSYGNRRDTLGNANRTSLAEIFDGPGFRRLRAAHARGRLTGTPCDHCLSRVWGGGRFARFTWPGAITRESGHCFLVRLPAPAPAGCSPIGAGAESAADPPHHPAPPAIDQGPVPAVSRSTTGGGVSSRQSWRVGATTASGEVSASTSPADHAPRLFEDGVPLGPADSLHQDIRDLGAGRFSVWRGWLYFSSSDGSDPRSNGREYRITTGCGSWRLPTPQVDTLSWRVAAEAAAAYASGIERMPGPPTMLGLVSSSDCNLQCPFCSQNKARRWGDRLRPEVVDEALAWVPRLTRLVWHGGEPFALPALRGFLASFDRDRNPNLTFGCTTNATLVGEYELGLLERIPYLDLVVSCDSFVPDTYARLRRGATLAEAWAGLERLRSLHDGVTRIVNVSMLVAKSTIRELPENLRFAIGHDLAVILSPVLVVPLTERLDVFSDPGTEAAGWHQAVSQAAAIVERARAGSAAAVERIDPGGMLQAIDRHVAEARRRQETWRPKTVVIEDPAGVLARMPDPGIACYHPPDSDVAIAYLRFADHRSGAAPGDQVPRATSGPGNRIFLPPPTELQPPMIEWGFLPDLSCQEVEIARGKLVPGDGHWVDIDATRRGEDATWRFTLVPGAPADASMSGGASRSDAFAKSGSRRARPDAGIPAGAPETDCARSSATSAHPPATTLPAWEVAPGEWVRVASEEHPPPAAAGGDFPAADTRAILETDTRATVHGTGASAPMPGNDQTTSSIRARARGLMVIHQFRPVASGAELQAERLATRLDRLGHPMKVLTQRRDSTALPSEVIGGAWVTRVEYPLAYWVFTHGVVDTFRHLVSHRHDYDVLHVHQAFGHAVVAVVVARCFRKRVLIKIACTGEFGDLQVFSRFRGFRWALRILHQADAIVAISKAVEDELARFGFPATRVRRIPNGVDAAMFRRQRPMPSRPPVRFVFVGRRHPQKGIDVLLRAVRQLIEIGMGSAFRVALYGVDYPEHDYRRLAARLGVSGVIDFLPFQADMVEIYHQAHCLLLPSRNEGLSNALLEAMALELPVIASAVSGTVDVVSDGENGWLVPAEDVAALAAAMRRVIEHPDAAAQLGLAARKTIEQHYRLEVIAAQYSNLYQELVAR